MEFTLATLGIIIIAAWIGALALYFFTTNRFSNLERDINNVEAILDGDQKDA